MSHLSASHALRAAAPLPLSEVDITGCIESMPRTKAGERQLTPAEAAFAQAFATSLQQLPQAQRAGLQATAGNIAEAVVEVVLVDLGWSPLYHDERPSSGGHGVDLVMLTPSMDKVAAIEVKATLQPDRWPRLAPVRMNQMTIQWLDKLGNAGMIATELQAADVYGFIAMVQFARRQLKAAVTEDFVAYSPINSIEQLEDLSLALNTSAQAGGFISLIKGDSALQIIPPGWPNESPASLARSAFGETANLHTNIASDLLIGPSGSGNLARQPACGPSQERT